MRQTLFFNFRFVFFPLFIQVLRDGEMSSDETVTVKMRNQHTASGEAKQNAEPPAVASVAPAQEQQWVSGFKLLPIIIAVTIASFLMLLDTSIVVTVSVTALIISCFINSPT